MVSNAIIKSILFFLSINLLACGGDNDASGHVNSSQSSSSQGSSGGGQVALPQVNQTLSFAEKGPIYRFVKETYMNQVFAQGIGLILYTSDNPDVATVDALSGQVTLLQAGMAIITAVIAADHVYLEATASYEIYSGLRFPQRASQTLSFADKGPISLTLGQVYTNQVYANGIGALIHGSSDTDVVTVDTFDGRVTAIKAGSATITVSIAADHLYESASNSYVVNVISSQ